MIIKGRVLDIPKFFPFGLTKLLSIFVFVIRKPIGFFCLFAGASHLLATTTTTETFDVGAPTKFLKVNIPNENVKETIQRILQACNLLS